MADDPSAARQNSFDPPEDNSSAEIIRKILAAIVGIIIIIIIVLAAKWVGDRIRERFLTPQTPTVQVIPPEETGTGTESGTPSSRNIASFSAIPATGPNDLGYAFLGLLGILGIATVRLSKRFAS